MGLPYLFRILRSCRGNLKGVIRPSVPKITSATKKIRKRSSLISYPLIPLVLGPSAPKIMSSVPSKKVHETELPYLVSFESAEEVLKRFWVLRPSKTTSRTRKARSVSPKTRGAVIAKFFQKNARNATSSS